MKKIIFALTLVFLACLAGFGQQWPTVPGNVMYMTDSLT
jgi:hypothetical protein